MRIGFRFSVSGLLEFIDWGGCDILFRTSRYLTGALNSNRYTALDIIERNMADGKICPCRASLARIDKLF